ncbi:MAG TPA: NPCBM/NEW2 domain-containing protein, partial [Tepidisphaeraceae bacterium]
MTDAQFRSISLEQITLDESGIRGKAPGGNAMAVAAGNLVQLARSAKDESGKELVLVLANGDQWVGQLQSFDGTSLTWSAANIGEMKVPIEQSLGIVRDLSRDTRFHAERAEDEVRLRNGDTLRGIVSAATAQSIEVTPTGGTATTVATEALEQVLFAAPPQGRGAMAVSQWRVRLVNGTRISTERVQLSGDGVRIIHKDGEVTVPADRVTMIEHTGGPISWLSNRQPLQSEHTPYFGGSFPARMNMTVTGEPIRFNNITYPHGIGVHSRSKLVFTVEPGDLRLRTRFAIDPALGFADVDVRVLVDEKVVSETKGFK